MDARLDNNFSVCDTQARLIINIGTKLETVVDSTLANAIRPTGSIKMMSARGLASITNNSTSWGVQIEMGLLGCAGAGAGN